MNLLRQEKIKEIEDNINEDVRNLFRPNEEIDDNAIKDLRNPFRLKKENEDIGNLFKSENEEYCHKPVRVGNFL